MGTTTAAGDETPEAAEDPPEADASSPGGKLGVTIVDLCRMAGVARSTVQQWTRTAGFPPRMADNSVNAFAAGVWYRDRQISKVSQSISTDPLMAGEGSDALEAYRWQKAILAGYDVEERRRSIIRMDDANEVFSEVARILRQSHETIQRQFGAEAHEILEDALREASVLINARFGADTDDDDNGPADPDADSE